MNRWEENWVKRRANGKDTPWNKGMKFPEMSGENNPTYSRVELECWECKNKFKVKNYRKHTAHFCSKECHRKTGTFGRGAIYRKNKRCMASG